jgi:tetratricopeptide (TPR) repeat protein
VKVAKIDEIEAIPAVGGELQWRPLRRTLGIEAFGINAYTANAGDLVVEEHDETGSGAGRHEELYIVITGRAMFTVDGKEIDAPIGTCVFLDRTEERRAARAVEDGTTVLAIGGTRGKPFQVSPWEFVFAAIPDWQAGRLEDARALIREGLERHPGNTSLLYDLACVEASLGEKDAALEHLRDALANPRFREQAANDEDFAPLRDDPRFTALVRGDA